MLKLSALKACGLAVEQVVTEVPLQADNAIVVEGS